jgi:hypothetical protein
MRLRSTGAVVAAGAAAAALVAAAAALVAAALGGAGCGGGGGGRTWTCRLPAGADGAGVPDALDELGCAGDFAALASDPLDATIPGARSAKVVLDQMDHDALHFQNSRRFPLHHDYAAADLSGPALPLVPSLAEFDATEYTSADRRFILGAVTYYDGPGVWALELAPYDTATPEMLARLYDAVRARAFFGAALAVHPTSDAVAATAAHLPRRIPIETTDQLYAGIDYQPLNLGTTIGQLRFHTAADLVTSYVGFRDVVVLDHVPNDISVVAGMITEDFQTPLSHVNVLAQNRGTPNMGLRGATTSAALRALEGKWVELDVGAFTWSVREASAAEADAWWAAHAPPAIALPPADPTVTDLRDVEDVTPEYSLPLADAIRSATCAFGSKAAHYSILAKTTGLNVRPGFAIPVGYYVRFMQENGFYDRVAALLADDAFRNDPAVRDAKLAELRAAMVAAPVDDDLQTALRAKLAAGYPGATMRFRSSTNAEDLDGFPCAGCYNSYTGDPADWNGSVLAAIKFAWSDVWLFRTFEERSYHGIDHAAVAMALLVHHNFPNENANGVALTANPFDESGLEPGFYVNVQKGGDAEVVHPPPGVTSDQLVYFYGEPGAPATYLAHSSLIPAGATVMTAAQLATLGGALDAIARRFAPAYGPAAGNKGWYAMDVEFKLSDEDDPGGPPVLWIKQARPSPSRGQ